MEDYNVFHAYIMVVGHKCCFSFLDYLKLLQLNNIAQRDYDMNPLGKTNSEVC